MIVRYALLRYAASTPVVMSTDMSSVRRRSADTVPAWNIQPHHQTTGVARASPSQLDSGGSTNIGTPGTWPASSVTGTVRTSATQNRRRTSSSIALPIAGSDMSCPPCLALLSRCSATTGVRTCE